MPMINLTPTPLTFLRSGGRQFGDAPGSEFVVLAPSGQVAFARQPTRLIPSADHVSVQGMAADSSSCAHGVFVDIHELAGDADLAGLPMTPGHYVVAAAVVEAMSLSGREICREYRVHLYSPMLLVHPGQPGHPGKDVLAGPYAPGLIRRV